MSQTGSNGRSASDRLLLISSDCHAGALPVMYEEYMPRKYHAAATEWWLGYAREMMHRAGTFFDQEAVEAYAEQAGEGGGRMKAMTLPDTRPSDDEILAMLADETSPFAPRRGEFDPTTRLAELEADGIVAEVVFPQMAPFGAGLMQYRHPVPPEHNLEGIRAYNRWLADLCKTNPGRHAGVALINVEDIDVTVKEIRNAKDMGLWGGVLLPTSTGDHPYYHDERYEPIWSVCEELGMPIQSHAGWSPDYGDGPAATPMYISEVDMWAHRPFTALLWSGAFERHPDLKYVLTETGCSWILETLRVLEFKADNPIFKHFTKDLSLRPSEYFARQCFIGASFMPAHEGRDRHAIGLDKLMWGSDYPHLEGTWPNTMEALRETFGTYPEAEIRALLGTNAAEVYGFDLDALAPIAERIGPTLSELRAGA
ncbi:MAG TPA: amidohydrolase [Deltaproteobacteria bacterium]|nr:amidohydrolase [Deltaproteobacteria bacterium]